MIAYLKSLLLIRFSLATRWVGDSCKTVYIMRSDRLYPDCEGASTVALAAGLTTGDEWHGVKGMLVIGGFPDCTGGHKATKPMFFRLIGMERIGSFVRKPAWLWRPWYSLSAKLQYMVDTRHKNRQPSRFTARKARVKSAGNP